MALLCRKNPLRVKSRWNDAPQWAQNRINDGWQHPLNLLDNLLGSFPVSHRPKSYPTKTAWHRLFCFLYQKYSFHVAETSVHLLLFVHIFNFYIRVSKKGFFPGHEHLQLRHISEINNAKGIQPTLVISCDSCLIKSWSKQTDISAVKSDQWIEINIRCHEMTPNLHRWATHQSVDTQGGFEEIQACDKSHLPLTSLLNLPQLRPEERKSLQKFQLDKDTLHCANQPTNQPTGLCWSIPTGQWLPFPILVPPEVDFSSTDQTGDSVKSDKKNVTGIKIHSLSMIIAHMTPNSNKKYKKKNKHGIEK